MQINKRKKRKRTIHYGTSVLTVVEGEVESIPSDLVFFSELTRIQCLGAKRGSLAQTHTSQDLKIEITDSFHRHEVDELALVCQVKNSRPQTAPR